jgi:hypothetical protein
MIFGTRLSQQALSSVKKEQYLSSETRFGPCSATVISHAKIASQLELLSILLRFGPHCAYRGNNLQLDKTKRQ